MGDDVRAISEGFALAHAREDVKACLSFFADDTVWAISRVVSRGREELGAFLRDVLPGGHLPVSRIDR